MNACVYTHAHKHTFNHLMTISVRGLEAKGLCACLCVCVSRCNRFTVTAKPLRLVSIRKSPLLMQVTGNFPNVYPKVCVCQDISDSGCFFHSSNLSVNKH